MGFVNWVELCIKTWKICSS